VSNHEFTSVLYLPCLSSLILGGDHIHRIGPVISTILGPIATTGYRALVGSRSETTSITIIDSIITGYEL